jgi:hypothetical protein
MLAPDGSRVGYMRSASVRDSAQQAPPACGEPCAPVRCAPPLALFPPAAAERPPPVSSTQLHVRTSPTRGESAQAAANAGCARRRPTPAARSGHSFDGGYARGGWRCRPGSAGGVPGVGGGDWPPRRVHAGLEGYWRRRGGGGGGGGGTWGGGGASKEESKPEWTVEAAAAAAAAAGGGGGRGVAGRATGTPDSAGVEAAAWRPGPGGEGRSGSGPSGPVAPVGHRRRWRG